MVQKQEKAFKRGEEVNPNGEMSALGEAARDVGQAAERGGCCRREWQSALLDSPKESPVLGGPPVVTAVAAVAITILTGGWGGSSVSFSFGCTEATLGDVFPRPPTYQPFATSATCQSGGRRWAAVPSGAVEHRRKWRPGCRAFLSGRNLETMFRGGGS